MKSTRKAVLLTVISAVAAAVTCLGAGTGHGTATAGTTEPIPVTTPSSDVHDWG